MAKPFEKDIPWYPGEDLRKDLPTAEDSAFNDPAEVVYGELLYLRNTPLVIPERSRKSLPGGAVTLVNQTLSQAFPWAYRSLLPPLKETDIFIGTDGSLSMYRRQSSAKTAHSKRLSLVQNLIRQVVKINIQEPQLEIVTYQSLPNKPIYYPEIALQFGNLSAQAMNQNPLLRNFALAKAAYKLIHENIHRATEGVEDPERATEVDPSSPLIDLAFSYSLFAGQHSPDIKIRGAISEMRGQLMAYVKTHQSRVVIEGARLILYCMDEDGKFRNMVTGGYSLNEALVEWIASLTIPFLLEGIRERASGSSVQAVENYLTAMASSAGILRGDNFLINIRPYLERLSLRKMKDIFGAYREGDIPALHTKLEPYQSYFP